MRGQKAQLSEPFAAADADVPDSDKYPDDNRFSVPLTEDDLDNELANHLTGPNSEGTSGPDPKQLERPSSPVSPLMEMELTLEALQKQIKSKLLVVKLKL